MAVPLESSGCGPECRRSRARSALAFGVVLSVPVLFPGVLSSGALAVATTVKSAVPSAVPFTVIVTVSPAGMVPSAAVTSCPASVTPPCVAVAFSGTNAAGSVDVSWTLEAGSVPMFSTVTVAVTGSPCAAGFGVSVTVVRRFASGVAFGGITRRSVRFPVTS